MAKGRVLIVDDEASEAKVFRFYLEALPVDTKVVHSTQEATSLLASERFHAVLCDLVMEGGGGLEVLGRSLKYDEPQQPGGAETAPDLPRH